LGVVGRRNRRAPQAVPLPAAGAFGTVQSHPDGDWHVRQILGAAATKAYRCPGCQQEIRPGTAHVVAWRADTHDGDEHRRHWHTPCWNARDRRRPGG
jgi:hypothetical protein